MRYGLNRPRIRVVPHEYVVVGRAVRGGVVGVKAPLEVTERLRNDPSPTVISGQPGRRLQENLPEGYTWGPVGPPLHP